MFLFTLESRFRDVPWQAIPSMAYTAPSDLTPVWPKKANKLIRLACENKTEWMRIKRTAHDEAVFVDLTIKMLEGVMDIRTLLKDFGYARDMPKVGSGAQLSV